MALHVSNSACNGKPLVLYLLIWQNQVLSCDMISCNKLLYNIELVSTVTVTTVTDLLNLYSVEWTDEHNMGGYRGKNNWVATVLAQSPNFQLSDSTREIISCILESSHGVELCGYEPDPLL